MRPVPTVVLATMLLLGALFLWAGCEILGGGHW